MSCNVPGLDLETQGPSPAAASGHRSRSLDDCSFVPRRVTPMRSRLPLPWRASQEKDARRGAPCMQVGCITMHELHAPLDLNPRRFSRRQSRFMQAPGLSQSRAFAVGLTTLSRGVGAPKALERPRQPPRGSYRRWPLSSAMMPSRASITSFLSTSDFLN